MADTKESEEYKTITMPLMKDMTNTFGAIQKQFVQYLEILNEEFKKYIDNMREITIRISKQLKKETGLIPDDMINKINLQ